ncbi:hypothetical protein Ddye_002034 [Dipteronia dyeriana]|uniref:MINDY deubiquitinase domain-containing protein n=1 Tax=Dipteronia dyeriana TaxID=168575 RepID=A0AAE0CTZ1_9ROSI|nr:hypothetical protein Ddye_002034 [Dipteronia dyeriana]
MDLIIWGRRVERIVHELSSVSALKNVPYTYVDETCTSSLAIETSQDYFLLLPFKEQRDWLRLKYLQDTEFMQCLEWGKFRDDTCLRDIFKQCNVLLLRNDLNLSLDIGEVSLEKLLSLVAERLIDSNSNVNNNDAGSVENQQQNIAEAINLLPLLATGIDVNLKFRRIDDFEFTSECAIYHLLHISLYHGWIVDPSWLLRFEISVKHIGDLFHVYAFMSYFSV